MYMPEWQRKARTGRLLRADAAGKRAVVRPPRLSRHGGIRHNHHDHSTSRWGSGEGFATNLGLSLDGEDKV